MPFVVPVNAPVSFAKSGLSAVLNRQELATSYAPDTADPTFPGKIKGLKPPILVVHLKVFPLPQDRLHLLYLRMYIKLL